MTAAPVPHGTPAIGLRELRHHTREVIQRVQSGETVAVTDHGRPVARLVPVEPPREPDVLTRLVEQGLARRARRPGHRPPLRVLPGRNALTTDLTAARQYDG